MNRFRKTAAGFGLAAGLMVTAVMAQGMGGMGGGMGHGKGQGMGQGMGAGQGKGGGFRVVSALCGKEIATHCASTPAGPALRGCLEAKSKDLGETCRLAVEATGPDRGQGSGPVAQLCMNEIGKFCAGVPHGGGEVRDCLEKRKSELGQGCTVALDNTGWGRRR